MPISIKRQKGFTIVELLIVIVVIGILAAITIVVYSSIQQRAQNTAIINSANQSLRLIQAYIATNSTLPPAVSGGDGYACITTTSSCMMNSGPMPVSAVFDTAMSKIGNLPRTTPVISDNRAGITYGVNSDRMVNGESRPAGLFYYLKGVNQQCGLSGVLSSDSSTAPAWSSSGYTNGNVASSGLTLCFVSIPGPNQ